MGAAYFIVLENSDPGFDTFVNGKAVAKEARRLDQLASRLGVATLTSFCSQSADEIAEFLDDAGLEDGIDDVEEQWYDANSGLEVVRSILAHLDEMPGDVRDAASVSNDLREFERVLEQAAAKGTRWHMAVDF